MGRKKKNRRSFVGSSSSHQQKQQKKVMEDESQLYTEQDHQWQGLKDVMIPLLRQQDKGKEVILIDDDEEESNQETEGDEFIDVEESLIRKYLTCPICLGIMQQTHAVNECLHRFCKDCIDQSLLLVNHECPACRKHLPSKHNLRKDTRYDRIIMEFYPNINDDNNDDMMQTSFAETFQRQSEALLKRRLVQRTPLSSRSRSPGTDGDEDGQSYDGVRDASPPDHSFSTSDYGWDLNHNDDDDDDDGERTISSTLIFKWGRNGGYIYCIDSFE
ncbi:hypothetical protein AQUCO_03300052v1 [Aquilegia coerulea]|uniref:RING-type domain-containing protein n=1 Tax=Aquilegia coerulea TaxID=218851 RepID=A0A2G5CZ87_AQUCA|nr:hypothetical protein AQUCO_03300052v1 [Aquilegia coerulea]